MIVGVPREIKVQEYRVALKPEGVKEILKKCDTVLIVKDSGVCCSINKAD